MMEKVSDLVKWLPVAAVAVGLVSAATIAQFQITASAQEIEDNAESIDENEESIELIQRTLIQRQGEQALQVQRIETEQKSQGADLDQILLLLKQQTRSINQ